MKEMKKRKLKILVRYEITYLALMLLIGALIGLAAFFIFNGMGRISSGNSAPTIVLMIAVAGLMGAFLEIIGLGNKITRLIVAVLGAFLLFAVVADIITGNAALQDAPLAVMAALFVIGPVTEIYGMLPEFDIGRS
jgi:peptidoglycan/LPS O-acetylase OafA/YrhL